MLQHIQHIAHGIGMEDLTEAVAEDRLDGIGLLIDGLGSALTKMALPRPSDYLLRALMRIMAS